MIETHPTPAWRAGLRSAVTVLALALLFVPHAPAGKKKKQRVAAEAATPSRWLSVVARDELAYFGRDDGMLVLQARFVDELSYQQIGQQVGMSLEAVRKALFRLKKQVRLCVETSRESAQ